MKDNEFDEYITGEPVEEVKLDLDKVKDSIPECSNDKLCEMIVAERYFGFGDKIAPMCMEELAKRRIAGDDFEYEKYIDQAHKSLPVLDFSIPDIRAVLNQAIGKKFGVK